MKQSDGRTRNWTFILYPESSPGNWLDILDDLHIPFVVSPLHDKDIDVDGQPKKAHYHVALFFDGPKSYAQISKISQDLLSGTMPKPIMNTRGMIRYFVHLDNPEKYQYNWCDIHAYGGADLDQLCSVTETESIFMLKEILSICSMHHITEFCELVDFLLASGRDDLFRVTVERFTLAITAYIKSLRFKVYETAGETAADSAAE